MGNESPARGMKRVPKRTRCRPRNFTRQGSNEKANRPPHYHAVVEHDRRSYKGNPRAHPSKLWSECLNEGPDRTTACPLPHAKLKYEEWHRPSEKKNHPGYKERSSAIARCNPRKTPNISGANSHAEHSKQHTPTRTEDFGFRRHGHLRILAEQSTVAWLSHSTAGRV